MRTERVSTLVPELVPVQVGHRAELHLPERLGKEEPGQDEAQPRPIRLQRGDAEAFGADLVGGSEQGACAEPGRQKGCRCEGKREPASRDEVVLLGLYSASSHEREREDQDQVDPDGHGESESHARGYGLGARGR